MTVGVVSHDAGGAEILSSHIRRTGMSCLFALEGPAQAVFARKLGSLPVATLTEIMEQASWILCGTSWQSDLEWRALRMARAAGKRAVALLDHWVNYRERFERGGIVSLPDEIWVCDDYALRMARACFGEIPVRQVSNDYLNDVRLEIELLHTPRARASAAPAVLYVCEPVREHSLRQYGNERHLGYVEEEAIAYFLRNLRVIAPAITRVRIDTATVRLIGDGQLRCREHYRYRCH